MISTKRMSQIFIVLMMLLGLIWMFYNRVDSYDSNGHAIRLSDYRGKWVIINYWAGWCRPCVTEIPVLEKLYKTYHDQVMVLGVNFDQLSNAKLHKGIIKRLGMTYPLLGYFPIKHLGVIGLRVEVLPTSFVINPQGKLSVVLKGPQTKKSFIRAMGGLNKA